jgi:hypothetical protein
LVAIRVSFADDIAAAKAAPVPTSEPISVLVGESLYELVFAQAPGDVWAAVTSKHPMRLDQPIDRTYGYNFHAVVAEIAETTCTVTKDGELVDLILEKYSTQNTKPVNEWRDLFAVVGGSAYTQLADACFQLNQWGPDQRVAELKKASRVASEPSSV